MRILQISSARHFGGGERHLTDLCRGLAERGHTMFVALRPTNEWQDRLDFIPSENFLKVSIRNSFGMFSAKRIGRFVIENKIDIIHAHVARDYLAAGIAARVAKGAKFVLTRHVLFPLKPFHRLALNNLDAAIAVSEGVAEQLREVFPAKKIHTISNGLDVRAGGSNEIGNEFRRENDIPIDAPVICSIGELKPLKGQLDLILAASEVIKSVPNVRFVIAGVDNTSGKKFRRELKRLAHKLGISEQVLWLDWIEDTRPLLSAADIFVSPSHSESFGLAILEAMASGVAVIATETYGAATLIGDRGLLVPVSDPVALGRRLTEMLGDRDRMATAGETLRARAADQFSIKRFIDRHEQLYQAISS